MGIYIKPAALEQKLIIHALLQPYLAELSQLPGEDVGGKDKNGFYRYPYLDAYWQEEGTRFPYLLFHGEDIAGFALVRKDNEHWEMAEFYVKPEFRQQSIAKTCTANILSKHPGAWRIEYNPHNQAGGNLWRTLAANYSSGITNRGQATGGHDYICFEVSPNQELFTYYNERAPEYEAFYAGEFPTGPRSPALYKADTQAVQQLLPHYVKGKCLDIACGTGFWLPCYGLNCSAITLIDQAEGVLAECRKKIETLGIKEKTNIIRGDVFKDIPLYHGYDSAIAGFFVSHLNDEELGNFLSIVKSALAPGGRLIMIDSVWGEEAKTHHRDQNGMAARRLYDGRTFNIYKRYFTREELGSIAVGNGLKLEILYWGEVFYLAAGQFT